MHCLVCRRNGNECCFCWLCGKKVRPKTHGSLLCRTLPAHCRWLPDWKWNLSTPLPVCPLCVCVVVVRDFMLALFVSCP